MKQWFFNTRCWIHFASENPSMHTFVISSLRFLYLYMLSTFLMVIKTVTFKFLGFTIVFYWVSTFLTELYLVCLNRYYSGGCHIDCSLFDCAVWFWLGSCIFGCNLEHFPRNWNTLCYKTAAQTESYLIYPERIE